LFFCLMLAAGAHAEDRLIEDAQWPNGDKIPYLLTVEGAEPKYVVILMPGGTGRLEPHMQKGEIKFFGAGNFLIRSRDVFADQDFAAVSTDATQDAVRMQAIVDDVQRRFKAAEIYLIGTSRSTLSTISLAKSMDGKVAGFIHTSSMAAIGGLDTRGFKSRHLIVHHRNDECRVTPPYAAIGNNKDYGTALILVEGGVSYGDVCEARAHHGYNGVEADIVGKIKDWIRKAGR